MKSFQNFASINTLESLHLGKNDIEDITPIVDARNLEFLNLGDNNIEKLPEDLSGLKSIERLSIHDNEIKDFTPVATLDATTLERFSKAGNEGTDYETLKVLKEFEDKGVSLRLERRTEDPGRTEKEQKIVEEIKKVVED